MNAYFKKYLNAYFILNINYAIILILRPQIYMHIKYTTVARLVAVAVFMYLLLFIYFVLASLLLFTGFVAVWL